MLEKTVRIPVEIRQGEIVPLVSPSPTLLPPFKEKAVGWLTLFESDVDPKWAKELNKEKKSLLLPKGTEIFFPVNPAKVMSHLQGHLRGIPFEEFEISAYYRAEKKYVGIVLHEDLTLHLRGSKKARLEPCRCSLSALNILAESLNEAYKLIVQNYEPHRRSNAGNVFHLGIWRDDRSGLYRFLETRRQQEETAP